MLRVLAQDASEWRHGYQLLEQLGMKSGSLYPILERLNSRGYLEYLQTVESLVSTAVEPAVQDLPTNPLGTLEDHVLIATYPLARGQLSHPWYVAHASKANDRIVRHRLIFWRFDGKSWQLRHIEDLGNQYIASIQKIRTRSAIEEELLAWRRYGESMGAMSYDVFAVDGEALLSLLHREERGAYVFVRGTAIYEEAGDRVTCYQWDGTAYSARRVVRHAPVPVDVLDLHYVVHPDGTVSAPDSVELAIGQIFRVLRDDFEYLQVRMLGSAGGPVEWVDRNTFKGVAPGESEITLIPDAYDWDKAHKIIVIVR